MGLARLRDAGIAGEDVVQRRNLAQMAMMISLDARSKHDLGPLRCGSAPAPPRVLGWRLGSELRLDRRAATPSPGCPLHVHRLVARGAPDRDAAEASTRL